MQEDDAKDDARKTEAEADDWAEPFIQELRRQGHDGTCPYPCPVCMGIGLLKQMRPDVANHLVAAGRELMLAARAFLESATEDPRRQPPVEKIPFD